MINKISESIVSWLEREGTVPESEMALYRYAAYSFIWGTLPVVIVTVWGIIFEALQESILFIFPFMLIRKFSGGYHLSKPGICFGTSTILLGFAVWGIKSINGVFPATVLTSLVMIAVTCICVVSPIDSASRRLSAKETRVFGRCARAIAIMMFIMYIILLFTERNHAAISVGVGIILPAGLQVPVLIRNLFSNMQNES